MGPTLPEFRSSSTSMFVNFGAWNSTTFDTIFGMSSTEFGQNWATSAELGHIWLRINQIGPISDALGPNSTKLATQGGGTIMILERLLAAWCILGPSVPGARNIFKRGVHVCLPPCDPYDHQRLTPGYAPWLARMAQRFGPWGRLGQFRESERSRTRSLGAEFATRVRLRPSLVFCSAPKGRCFWMFGPPKSGRA